MIDVSEWGNFRVGDLFDIHPTAAYKMTNKKLMNDDGINPVIVNSGFNNGVGGYTNQKCTEKAGVITFTDTAAKSSESFFYQDEDFVGYPHVQGMYSKFHELNIYEGEFIVTALRCAAGKFDFIIKMTRDEVLDFNIKLPITSDGHPNWNFMESYMRSVMEKSEKSLEYIKRTDDAKHLIDVSGWGEFRVGDLFEEAESGYIGNGKKIGSATKEPDDIHTIPLTCAKFGNNGIMYYGKKGDFSTQRNVLAVIRDGAISTGMVYAEEDETGVYSHSYFIKNKNDDVSFLSHLFVSRILTNTIYPKYTRDDTCIWDKTKEELIRLPIDSNGSPDWQYMENYMKQILDKSVQQIGNLGLGVIK